MVILSYYGCQNHSVHQSPIQISILHSILLCINGKDMYFYFRALCNKTFFEIMKHFLTLSYRFTFPFVKHMPHFESHITNISLTKSIFNLLVVCLPLLLELHFSSNVTHPVLGFGLSFNEKKTMAISRS